MQKRKERKTLQEREKRAYYRLSEYKSVFVSPYRAIFFTPTCFFLLFSCAIRKPLPTTFHCNFSSNPLRQRDLGYAGRRRWKRFQLVKATTGEQPQGTALQVWYEPGSKIDKLHHPRLQYESIGEESKPMKSAH
jgi:hypothetical protein